MADGYVYRTAITRLQVTEGDRRLLERTIDEWRHGCQIAAEVAFPDTTEKRAVQSAAYDRVREETALGSQHTILATHRAAEAVAGVRARRQQGKSASKPTFTRPTVLYDDRTMTLFDDETVSLTTVDRRVRCELVLPSDEDGYQYRYLDDERWSVTESSLTIRNGEFYLHIGFRRPEQSSSTAEDGAVLGVDFGIANLAVTSTARFFPGGAARHEREQFERRRAALQRTGTRSARRTLQRLSDREKRRHCDRLHRIASEIVDEAIDHDCSVIAVEDLSGIREQIPDAGWFHRWAFRRLRSYITYKARASDIAVRAVDPADTSRRCAECSHCDEANRLDRSRFVCQSCGSEANADYNAAKNIGLRYVRRDSQSSRRTGARRCALKSGTVTADGSFRAR